MSRRSVSAAESTQLLIGRTAELSALRALVESSPFALLTGAAGVGKSALARAALPEARVISLAGARDAADISGRTGAIWGFAADSAPAQVAAALAARHAITVWDDAHEAAPGAIEALLPAWRHALAPGRVLLLSRCASMETELPSLALQPLAPEACRALVAALDAERALSLHARIAQAAAGNPMQARLLLERACQAMGEPAALETHASGAAAAGATVDEDAETLAWAHLAAGDVTAALAAASGRAPLAETLALLAADELDRAAARAHAISDAAAARLVAVALAWRRGELRAAHDEGLALAASLAASGETVLAAAATAIAGRAALGLGDVGAAELLLRRAEAALTEAAAPALLPPVELGFLLLAALRGDWDESRRRAERVAALWPRSPLMAVERWWARGERVPPPAADLAAANALGQLRAAERALGEGRYDEANADARAAERAYRQAGAGYDRALALLARFEALARLDAGVAADKIGRTCAALAEGGGYRVIAVALALVEAHRADRAGDLVAYVSSLARARRLAGAELRGHALAAACARVGLPPRAGPIAEGQPLRDRLTRLGLLRAAQRLCSAGGRAYLLAEDEPLPPADLLAVVDEGVVRARGREWPLAPQLLLALEAVAEAGQAGITPEQLYTGVWDGGDYHPLRHRNAVYVALNRLRAALEPILGKDFIQSRGADYAIAPGVRIACVRELGREGPYGTRRHRLSPAQARWQRAIAAALEDDCPVISR